MQINNEPVAVVDHRQQNGVTWLKIKKGKSVMPDHNTLLYTHPAKTLTDFEIKGVLGLDECWVGEDCSIPNMIAFARAILRKASE